MESVWIKIIACCISLAILSACQNGDGVSQSQGGNAGLTLAGTVGILAANAVDSDVNDNNAAYQANDFLISAQAIADTITLGGYVNLAGEGPQGRSFAQGDSDDYFSSFLRANQTVTISFDNLNTQALLDLVLLNSQGVVVQSAKNIVSSATLTISTQDKYYIHVQINGGAASYLLKISEPSTISNINLLSVDLVSSEFVPGDVIVKFQPSITVLNNTARQINSLQKTMSADQRAESVALQLKGGGSGRGMLFNLGSINQRQKAIRVLGINKSIQRAVDETTQLKLDTIALVNRLRKRADVASARLNYIRHATAIPNDPYYDLQWHFQQINLHQAWDITTGSAQVTVAVIDTGVLLNHPDLQGKLLGGYDFIRDVNNSVDGDGIDDNPNDNGSGGAGMSSYHGTHVAGTIAAASNNGLGVAGVAWNVNIMPLRVLGPAGGTDYDIEQAVRYAAGLANDSNTLPAIPADVINLSLGGPLSSTVAPDAFRLAREAGVIIVAAAGNDAANELSYPASLDGVVSVSAVDFNSQIAPYSNFGPTVDISAPGGDTSVDSNNDSFFDGVLSTWANDDSNGSPQFVYAFFQGTSMATPHVAGVVALMRSVDSMLTPDEFDQLLSSGAISDDLGANGRDDDYGHGLINAFKAVSAVSSQNGSNTNPGNTQAVVTPELLNFSYMNSTLTVEISKQGVGNLRVLDLNSNISWLSFNSVTVDNDGFGAYSVAVDRSALAAGTYLVNADISTDNGIEYFPIVVQVLNNQGINNAGVQYISLLDAMDNPVKTLQIQPVNGVYTFQFDGIPAGTYKLISNSDNNANLDRCGTTEACGNYQDINNNELIVIENSDKLDLNFATGYPQP